jgi:hypothetical protein
VPAAVDVSTLHLPLTTLGYPGVLQLSLPNHRFRGPVRNRQRGLLSLCAWCRGAGAPGPWAHIERFLAQNRVDVTHGICASCRRKVAGGRAQDAL